MKKTQHYLIAFKLKGLVGSMIALTQGQIKATLTYRCSFDSKVARVMMNQ